MSYTLTLDTETFCATPIKQGAHRYAEDAEILLVAYAVDDEPVVVLDTSDDWASAVAPLQALIDGARVCILHNSAFDRTVLRHRGVTIPLEKIEDTMVLALQHGLPGGLDQLCDILGVPKDKAKDKAGKKLIQLFCKPRPKNVKLRRATKETHPDEWAAFIEYARLDVDATRHVHSRLPRWNDSNSERDLWRLDQAINDRGFAVDVEHARSALRAFDGASRSLGLAAASLTGGVLNSTTQRDALIAYLKRELDFDVENLQKGTVEKLLAGEVPGEVRQLLENRQEAAATSPSKYRALLGAVSSDGRLRGTIQFCGASRTGRDAGRIFQPQNLPRTPDWFDAEAQEATVRAFKAGIEDLLFEDIVDRCSFAIRGCLVPERGNKLLVSDLSNIEGRTLAWLAGEQWKIEAFKAYDRGEGHDLYKVTAGRILGKDPGDVVKIERQNQGKVPELAGGYQGGVGAYRKMGGPVFNAMTDDEIMEIVQAWRAAHPRTKSLWYEMEAAAKAAINKHGESFEVRGLIRFDVVTDRFGIDWLRMRLPSGRYLVYCRPKLNIEECHRCAGSGKVLFLHNDREMQMVCPDCNGSGHIGSGQVSYEGVNQYTRQWTRLDTYGGKLTENTVQAIARDVFFSGLKRAMAAGYGVVLRVHDELVCEVPLAEADKTADGLSALMATNDSWNVGLPLAAAGDELMRYGKT